LNEEWVPLPVLHTVTADPIPGLLLVANYIIQTLYSISVSID